MTHAVRNMATLVSDTNGETAVGVLLDSNVTLLSANQIRGPEITVI